jgi:tripartite-type tricarboxylate transporter receptor subunit TctC
MPGVPFDHGGGNGMLLKLIVTAAVLALGIPVAAAQQYPTRVVKIVIPFPPGGGIDVLVRALAAELGPKWGQPVIVENRAGAGGNLGAEAVAKSAPDGYTLFATVNQTFTANRHLYKTLPYDPERGYVPIMLMVQSDHFLLAHPSVAARDLRELVALARRTPGKLNYGSFGTGSQPQLVYEMLNKKEGLDLQHVPYKGIAPLLTAVTAGEVHLATGSSGVAGELIKAGRLKALAIAAKQRSPQAPGVPTTVELGYPYAQASIWYGLFAPAATPAAIVERIGAEVRAILKTPAFAERHATSKGLDVIASTAQELAATIRDETASLGEMIRAAGIRPE